MFFLGWFSLAKIAHLVLLDGGEHHLDPRGVGYRILSECEIASQLTSSSNSEQQPELLIV